MTQNDFKISCGKCNSISVIEGVKTEKTEVGYNCGWVLFCNFFSKNTILQLNKQFNNR